MKHKTRLLPLAGLLLAGGILCTGCGGAAPASSAPAAVSTASSVASAAARKGISSISSRRIESGSVLGPSMGIRLAVVKPIITSPLPCPR